MYSRDRTAINPKVYSCPFIPENKTLFPWVKTAVCLPSESDTHARVSPSGYFQSSHP